MGMGMGMGSIIAVESLLQAALFGQAVLFGESVAGDKLWDIGLTIVGWVLGLIGSILLGVIAHFARKADKKLDQVVEVQGKHAELFASVLERSRHHDEWRTRIETDQNKQWEHIKEHGDALADHGQSLAAHGESLQFLKSHPVLAPRRA